MATFRMVQTEFWNDPKVSEEMTPEDKYFFLYLLTNKNTTQIGIYQITKKQMAFDTGYSQESINALLDRFVHRHKNITYNPDTREIAIKNWGKYNFNRGGKPVMDCIESELKSVKDVSLISYVADHIEMEKIKELYEKYLLQNGDEEIQTELGEIPLNQGFYDALTSRGQEEEKEQEKEVEEEEKVDKNNAAAATIIQTFESCLCRISPLQMASLQKWVDDFKDPNIVLEAIKIADDRNRRTFGFVEYLLREWMNKKLTKLNQIQNYEQFKFLKKANDKNLPMGRDVPKAEEFPFDLSAGEGGKWD